MKTCISTFLNKIAENPNDDPQELFNQIRPLLNKLSIATMIDAPKTQIIIGETNNNNNLYCMTLRRTAIITKDIIDRIKRNEDYFEKIVWSSKAMEIYLWWSYESKNTTK